MPALANARVPLPILVATGRNSLDSEYVPGATVYEMTPFEFGSWDPITINGFAPMSLLGSPMARGYPSTAYCMEGFDNAAWVTFS
jgi:lysophospholipase